MLRAILFDFDGVIADSEPIHCEGFQKVLAEVDLHLSKRDYYKRYLGYGDRDCFEQIYKDRKRQLSRSQLKALMTRKTRYVRAWLRSHNVLLPGARRAIKMLGRRYPLAIVSGALRQEILIPLRRAQLHNYFVSIISAEDVRHGKPHPEGYQRSLHWLNQNTFSSDWPLQARECLVIEDSHWGIQAAHRAKMPCVGVTTSYPRKAMKAADLVLRGLNDINVAMLPKLERLTN